MITTILILAGLLCFGENPDRQLQEKKAKNHADAINEIDTLLNEITYSKCSRGHESTCVDKPAKNWKLKLRNVYGKLLQKTIPDQVILERLERFAQFTKVDVDLARDSISYLESIAEERRSKQIQEGIVRALIEVMHWARPQGKSDQRMAMITHGNIEEVYPENQRLIRRDRYEPGRLAIDKLATIYENNINDDGLTEEIMNALEGAARYDTSYEIYVAAKNKLELLRPDDDSLADSIDCERFANKRVTTSGTITTRDAVLSELCE